MKLELSIRKRKIIFYLTVAISFIAIMIYNFLTPLMSDELLFDASIYHSIIDILKVEYNNYMTWNGRSVVQIIMQCFCLVPKWLFNICTLIFWCGILVYLLTRQCFG